MQSKYPIFEKREAKRIIIISCLAILSLLYLSIFLEWRFTIFFGMLAPIYTLVHKIRTSYIIDEEKMTFSIMFGKKEWRKVNLNDISKMEIHRKKNGKIKKINLRNSSNIFFTAEPARGDEFASQIKKLLPGINTEERKAKWYS
jgi:hypothetical protein